MAAELKLELRIVRRLLARVSCGLPAVPAKLVGRPLPLVRYQFMLMSVADLAVVEFHDDVGSRTFVTLECLTDRGQKLSKRAFRDAEWSAFAEDVARRGFWPAIGLPRSHGRRLIRTAMIRLPIPSS